MKFFTKYVAVMILGLVAAVSSPLLAQTLQITSPTSSSLWCAGTNQSVTWTSSGVLQVRIEGSPDGFTYFPIASNIEASTGSYSYTIPSNFPSGNQYRFKISDQNNPNTSSTSDAFTVATAPAITNQPSSQNVCLGQAATLSVGATGGSLTYQWFKNNTAISGATSEVYNFTGSTAAEGNYHVVITSPCGGPLTSSTAIIDAVSAPTITSQPTPQTAAVGGTATFTVSANDAITYQWRKNGVNTAITSNTLTLTNVQPTDAGNYDVQITNNCGTIVSITAKLSIAGPILSLPTSVFDMGTILSGGAAEKTVIIRNSGTTTLQVSSINISGTNAGNFTISGGNAPFSLEPEATREVKIRFSGTNIGDQTAIISFTSNSITSDNLTLIGKINAGNPVLSVESAVNFGTIKPNETSEKTLTITNTGNSTLSVSTLTITGANASNFTVALGNAPFDIAPGATRSVTLRFTAGAVGVYNAIATFTSNAATPTTVNLSGVSSLTGGSSLSITSTVNFGETLVNNASTKTVTITNNASTSIMINSVVIEGSSLFTLAAPFTPVSLNPGGSKDVDVKFLPLVEGSATATLRVTAADGELSTQLSGLGVLSLAVNELESSVNALQVMPNPVMDRAIVSVTFERSASVEIQVADMTGRIIRTLHPMTMVQSGSHTFVWDRTNDAGQMSASGMYRIIIRGASGIVTMPVVVAD